MSSGLRIALVTEVMETGVGQLVSLQARELAARGHDVHLLHSIRRVDPALLYDLRSVPNLRCARIDMRRELHGADLRAAGALRGYLKRHGPFDIIHGHSSKGGALARLASIGLPGARLYSPHAFYTLSPTLSGPRSLVYSVVERALSRLCDAVVCCSEAERQHALALGIAAKQIAVIVNGIDPPPLASSQRERFGFPADTVIIGFVGRLADQKAPDMLIDSFARATASHPDLGLVIIGDGPLDAKMRERAAARGIAARLRWLGQQPSSRYLSSFDILAMPSRYEGFSLVPLEAMHAGLPIVCTKVGGIDEAVVDGTTGLVVPIGDAAAFAAAIVALARLPAQRRAFGQAAYQRAALFSTERMLAATEQLYRDLLASRKDIAERTVSRPRGSGRETVL